MHPFLSAQLAALHESDLQRNAEAARVRALHAAPAAAGNQPAVEVVIRRTTHDDGPALTALAALDGTVPPFGPALVAEVAGSPRAVLPLDGSPPFADPFRRTEELVALLELRAAQLARADRTSEQRRGWLGWFAHAALRRPL
jgi:hypothetical protein